MEDTSTTRLTPAAFAASTRQRHKLTHLKGNV
jgi:hypothetical protein